MLIYNKKLSVVPVTTHIPIKLVSKNIKKDLIIEKVKTVNRFYEKFFKKSPKIAILGLNPHNFSNSNKFNEQEIINKSIKKLLKLKIKVVGPIAADSSFVVYKKYKFDIIVGMYHDQVLGPFKALFKFDAINITLGLSYLRVSPDHGVGENIVGKKIANPYSLIKSIKFFNYIN
jgi:4-hydroxy-L-threonine phosphate dehydrogenase PdxA